MDYSLADGEIPWPAAGHSLFHKPGPNQPYADLHWLRSLAPALRIISYRRAAELIYSQMVTGQAASEPDLLFFPYAFCRRHYVELRLKSLIQTLHDLADEQPNEKLDHSIAWLWQKCASLLGTHMPEENDDLEHAGRIVSELAGIDPDSTTFRYATGRDGNLRPPPIKRVNLHKFHDAMSAVANFLDAAEDAATERMREP